MVSGLPTKQDLNAMAASIVNALTRGLHDLQVDTMEERVTVIESSNATTNAHITSLETEHRAFRRHLVDVQLRLVDGENREQAEQSAPPRHPEATMGPDICTTFVAFLNQVLGKPATTVSWK